jgi:ADP-heptose:LPS heptosyltransferase
MSSFFRTIKAFHKLYPQAALSVLIYKHSKPLVEHLPGVNESLYLRRGIGDGSYGWQDNSGTIGGLVRI